MLLRNNLSFKLGLLCTFVIFLIGMLPLSWSAPTGINITSNVTETPAVSPASSLTTAGGSFTTLVLNGSFQNDRWKAYVGNVTGELTLSDASSQSIYDWNLAAVSGQVYLSRNNSVEWTSAECANSTNIAAEETFFNINSTKVDSISNTFNQTIHKSFFVGTVSISNSTCSSIATNVNDASQAPSESAAYQEVLLQDGSNNVVYTTLIENAETGYDGSSFDFQLIVPEDSSSPTPTTYYFYAELN